MTKSRVIRLSKSMQISLSVLLICALLIGVSVRPIQKRIYPIKYESIVMEMADQHRISPSLIYAIIHTESKFDPYALSPANAYGLMQITEDTYRWVCQRTGQTFQEVDALYDPQENISCGVVLVGLLQERFDHIETVLAAYNAGQGKVNEWLKDPSCSTDGITLQHIPYEETENYVRRVINTQKTYQTLYNIP